MKKISIILAGALLAACTPDLNLNIPADKIGFSSTETVKEVSVFNESATIAVIKSGKGTSSASVKVGTAASATDVNIVPESLYTIDKTDLEFAESDTRQTITVTWDKDKMADYCKQTDAAIPIGILSCSADLDTARSLVLIYPHVAEVGFEAIDIKNVSPQEKKDMAKVVEGSGKIVLDQAINQDTQITLKVDNSLIPALSEERGVEYTEAPEGLVTLKQTSVTIKAGETEGTFDYTIDCSVLFGTSGRYKYPVCKFITPVAISAVTPAALAQSNISVSCVVVHLSSSGVVDPPATPSQIIFSDGTWEVIEGMEQDMAHDPQNPDHSWYDMYNCQKLVDGSLAYYTGQMGNWFWSENTFPITYVIDLKKSYIFKGFRLIDSKTHQNQYRHLHIWVAEDYIEGGGTVWFDACEGTRTYSAGWQQWPDANQTVEGLVNFTYHMPEDSDPEQTNSFTYRAGRYIKLQLVEPYRTTGDYEHGRGYLMEFYAEGWDNE